MLAYRIEIELWKAWDDFDSTVGEWLDDLSSLCAIGVNVGEGCCLTVPEPSDTVEQLIKASWVKLPAVLPHRMINITICCGNKFCSFCRNQKSC